MPPDFDKFVEYYSIDPGPVEFGNGTEGFVIGVGSVTLNTSHGTITLSRVLYVPKLVANLLSIRTSMRNKTDVHFLSDQQRVVFTQNNNVICTSSPA